MQIPGTLPEEPDGIVTTEVRTGYLVSTITGVVTGPTAEEVGKQLEEQWIKGMRVWIVDCSAVPEYRPAGFNAGSRIVSWTKERGVKRVIVVTASSLIRMAAVTIGLVTRTIRVCETLDEAEAMALACIRESA